MLRPESLLLYAVTDRYWLGDHTLEEDVERALKGGATFIQLREKELSEEDMEREARTLLPLCRRYGVPFVIDDDVELAKKVGADGVHVGQSDMACGKARQELGPDAIIGVSAGTVEQAVAAEKAGADYLGVGAVFPTGTKGDAEPETRETVRAICEDENIPVIAIGGVSRDNVQELSGLGLAGIAVVSAIFAQDNIESATAELRQKTESMVNA